MQYKIIVDKQSRDNPSSEKREYIVDIEELRVKGDIYDSLVITKDETYVMRKLNLSEYHVLSVLDTPVKEALEDLDIELFEGDNYIYLVDMIGNKMFAEYLVKNDFIEAYATKVEMNSAINESAKEIELSVNQKVEGLVSTEEMNSAITLTAQSITQEVNKKVNEDELGTQIEQNAEHVKVAWNKFSEFIQAEILKGNASIVIRDNSQNLLMSLDKTGQHFYDENNLIASIGLSKKNDVKYVSFGVNGKSGQATNAGFAWGINTEDYGFLPVFWMDSYYYINNSDFMTGKFTIAGMLDVIGKMGVNGGFYINGDIGVFFIEGADERKYFEIYSTDIGENSGFAFFDGHSQTYFQGYKKGGQDVYYIGFNNNDAIDIRNCRADNFINRSSIEIKKNIKEVNKSALEIIKKSKIYEYELKAEEKHKHYGFVIDKNKKEEVADEILSSDKEGIEIYSAVALSYKGIQEQQEEIKELKIENKKRDTLIKELMKRVEKLEEAQNGKN